MYWVSASERAGGEELRLRPGLRWRSAIAHVLDVDLFEVVREDSLASVQVGLSGASTSSRVDASGSTRRQPSSQHDTDRVEAARRVSGELTCWGSLSFSRRTAF
ncbi:MAG: hypothetical protein JO057_22255 [Chloroflexi bacterium]|nr:hypothetical protein [Chloroflexota bacterium]